MKILVTGNMGYVGPVVIRHLRECCPEAELVGLDTGYFSQCLTNVETLPECQVGLQHFADVRALPPQLLSEIDAVVHLAAISNDPMGNRYERLTLEINHGGSVQLAQQAKAAGVKSFVFASSCSVYGYAEDGARSEQSEVNPLTAYAKSKVFTERDLAQLADANFHVTCLRFATACGMSDRLRLDLVLNDFVAGAVACGKITILSDGTPWRPLIHVQDMARAIEWAIARQSGEDFVIVNTGCEEWNYQVRELAQAVARVIPKVEVSIVPNARPDKRSYKVDFGLFRKLAPTHQPKIDLLTAISGLEHGLRAMQFHDSDFRNSSFIRLRVLSELQRKGLLTEELRWSHGRSLAVAAPSQATLLPLRADK
jgi:nucleoside-diphosphate-sugar epimerase